MEKVFEGYRIVLEVDQEWFEAIAKMTSYAEYGELMNWLSSDPIVVTREVCYICDVMADEEGFVDHDEMIHDDAEEEV